MEELDKQESNKPKRDALGRLLPGYSGNLKGRPKGKTIKELVREWLEEHPNDMKAFVEHFVKKNKELAWQMLEGRPQQDVTSGGEKLIPIPILEIKNDYHKQDSFSQHKLEHSDFECGTCKLKRKLIRDEQNVSENNSNNK